MVLKWQDEVLLNKFSVYLMYMELMQILGI